jgi:hypothetical protein
VLVPRWLRHDNTQDGHTGLRRFSRHKDRDTADWAGDAEPGAEAGDQETPDYVDGGAAPGPGGPGESFGAYLGAPVAEADVSYEPATEVPPVPPYGWSAEEYLRHERDGRRGRGPRNADRSAPAPAGEPAYARDARPAGVAAGPRGSSADARGGSADARGGSADARSGGPGGSAGPRGGPGDPRDASPGARPGGPHGGGERPVARPGQHQARMVMARRRMLMMLVVLSLAAVAMAFLHLAASWVVIPPTVMLLGYMMLLREAARADAELRERRAAEHAAAMARRARERGTEAARAPDTGAAPTDDGFAPVWPAHEPLPHAEVIDISGRVGDQLYDQYADAKLRAVGD